MENRILNLHAETQQEAVKLAQALQQEGFSIGHSTVQRILQSHGRVAKKDAEASSWINQIFVTADPRSKIEVDVPGNSVSSALDNS